MAQYINKATLVAELESKIKYAQHLSDNAINGSMQQFYDGMKQGCVDILSFINTLEVKGVEKRTQHHIPMEDIENAAARYDGSMNCVGCFIGGAKWMEQRLKEK